MKKSDLPRRLSYQDAAFANFERDFMPMNVGSVGVYEGELAFERFLPHVERRIDLVPRYRQRLVPVPGNIHFPRWVDDPDFDVCKHVERVTLPPPADDAQLAAFAGEFFATPLRRDRPLWEMRLVEGVSGGRTAHVAKVHHCLVDGVGGVGLLGALLDTTPQVRSERKRHHAKPPPIPGPLSLLVEAIFDRMEDRIRMGERIALGLLDPVPAVLNVAAVQRALLLAAPYFAAPAPVTPWSRRPTAPARLAWQILPFPDVHAIANALGGTINDVVLTMVAGALGRFLREQEKLTDGLVLRAGLPVNVRRDEDQNALGNAVSFMLAGLPVGVADPVERFRTIHGEVRTLKDERQSAGIADLIADLGMMPPAMHALTGRTLRLPNTLTNLICTNVPGPLFPLYCQGHRMVAHYPWVPLGWRMGLSVAVMSYDTGLYFGITADRETPGDLRIIGEGLREEFEALREATHVPEMYRKEAVERPEQRAIAAVERAAS